MTNKNPYEIRLDVLKLAQEMLENEARMLERGWEEDGSNLLPRPKSPTVEDVIAKATTLYDFVSTSNASNSQFLTESRSSRTVIQKK